MASEMKKKKSLLESMSTIKMRIPTKDGSWKQNYTKNIWKISVENISR